MSADDETAGMSARTAEIHRRILAAHPVRDTGRPRFTAVQRAAMQQRRAVSPRRVQASVAVAARQDDGRAYARLTAPFANCPACGAHTQLVVDHDHTTGIVRGFLCGACNTALGMARDRADVLRALADYVERPPLAPLNITYGWQHPADVVAAAHVLGAALTHGDGLDWSRALPALADAVRVAVKGTAR